MDIEELHENWLRACRQDDDLRGIDLPGKNSLLLKAVLARVAGETSTPEAVLKGAAVGFSTEVWEKHPHAVFRQLALLVREAATQNSTPNQHALSVLTVLGSASFEFLVELWRNLAAEDELTRLGNRRTMELRTAGLETSNTPFAYASIDVNGLKAVNDALGHGEGDRLLKTVASQLKSALLGLEGASAFRYGGDEFGAILPLSLEGEQGEKLERLMQRALDELTGTASFSWGVACWPETDRDVATVIKQADERMYERKREYKSAQLTNGIQQVPEDSEPREPDDESPD